MITFHEIYERYSKDVYRYSFWLSGSAEDADDLTSETFARAWVGRHKIRTETVKAYLFAIARNLYLNQKRHAHRKVELSHELVDLQPGPDHLVESRLELEHAVDTIQMLSEVDRTAFLLRIQHELSYEEIARVMKLPLTTVKVKVHRARLKLAEAQLEKEKYYEHPKASDH
ncbi:MAG: RNA polymerase sigma factor [Anaerolineales bacterium]|nr:RNA polymerase sigma factor [Anaerolineales bacterium]